MTRTGESRRELSDLSGAQQGDTGDGGPGLFMRHQSVLHQPVHTIGLHHTTLIELILLFCTGSCGERQTKKHAVQFVRTRIQQIIHSGSFILFQLISCPFFWLSVVMWWYITSHIGWKHQLNCKCITRLLLCCCVFLSKQYDKHRSPETIYSGRNLQSRHFDL